MKNSAIFQCFSTNCLILLNFRRIVHMQRVQCIVHRQLSRFFDCLAHPTLTATDQKCTFSCLPITYKSLAECHLPYTLFERKNERQKIEPVPILLPRASRNFSDVKTRNEFYFHNWTSEIIPFICFGMQMNRT